MYAFSKGRYHAFVADDEVDIVRAQALRHLVFLEERGLQKEDRLDCDAFDPVCQHVLIEEAASEQLVCCFRLMTLSGGSEIAQSYSAQFYELAALQEYSGKMVEMGRFCIHPDWKDPDILRVAWSEMTRIVDGEGVEMLFGCSSFMGVDAENHMDAFALLNERHLAPRRWWPRVKAPEVFRFARRLRRRKPDLRRAMLAMPPLLRSYLTLGGWVSDHAVVDRDLGTMHVFTGLETGRIPDRRKRLMRMMAS